jgi:hypothetical protein
MFDDRALALEEKIKELNKREEDKAKIKLGLMIKGGQMTSLGRAIHQFENILDKSTIQAIWDDCHADNSIDPSMRIPPKFALHLSKARSQYADKIELLHDALVGGALGAFTHDEIVEITKCTTHQVSDAILNHMKGQVMTPSLKDEIKESLIPHLIVPFFKRPHEDYFTMTKTEIIREVVKNGILEKYSNTNLAKILQISDRTVRYVLESDADLKPHGLSALALQLKADPDYQTSRFPTRNAWLIAIFQHEQYKTLRTSEIAKVGFCPLSNVSTIKARLRDTEPKQEQPKQEQPKQEQPKVEIQVEAQPKQAEEQPKVEAQPKQEQAVEVKLIGQGEKIVSKQKIDDLLLALYPEGISREQIRNLSKVIKHLKQAIRSKG